MAVSVDELEKAIVAAGLMPADELKSLWEALPAAGRPDDGEMFAGLLVKQGKLTEFQSQELLSSSGAPLVLGDYILLAKIGAGGMGQVFKAQHRHMDRLVAIKLLPAAMTKDEAAVKRFQREVKAAARLSHPNIVAALDARNDRGVWCLVMEYVEGRDLSDIVKERGALPVRDAVAYILQAARGLAYAHGEGVIHRDIKPANLLLDKKGTVKILDMGLARFDSSADAADHQLTNTGQVMGTVDYMAPEQAANTRNADARSDVYALGCSLYRLLVGESMFGGQTAVEKILAHMNEAIPSLCQKQPDVPAEIDRIFQRMVAKKPADRYQLTTQLVADLEAYSNSGASATSMRPTMPERGSEPTSFLGAINQPSGGQQALKTPTKAAAELEQTVALLGPEPETDPKSESIIPAPLSPRGRGAGGEGPHRRHKPPVKLIAAGIGALALLVAFGIWVIVKDKDGNEVGRIRVPDGGNVVIQNNVPAPATSSTNSATKAPGGSSATATGVATTPSPPRWPLEPSKPEDIRWLHDELQATITLRSGPDKDSVVRPDRVLPRNPATIVGLSLPREGSATTTDDVVRRIGTLVDLESLVTDFAPPGAQVTKDGMAHLAALVQLRELRLGRFGPADTDYSFLERLPRLEKLRLSNQRFPNWTAQVARLKQLRGLLIHDMDWTQVMDLTVLPRLESFEIEGFWIDFAKRKQLGGELAKAMPRCRIVITDTGRKEKTVIEPTAASPVASPVSATTPVPRWPLEPSKPEDIRWLHDELQATITLRSGPDKDLVVRPDRVLPTEPSTIVGLSLPREGFAMTTDDAVRRIGTLVDLESLHGDFATPGAPVTKEGMAHLAALVQLRELTLGRFGTADTDYSFLERMPRLEKLRLSVQPFPNWVAQVVRLKQLRELSIFGMDLADLMDLKGLTRLAKFEVSGPGIVAVQPQLAGELAKAMPWCRVVIASSRTKTVIEPTAPLPSGAAP